MLHGYNVASCNGIMYRVMVSCNGAFKCESVVQSLVSSSRGGWLVIQSLTITPAELCMKFIVLECA